MLYWRWIHKNFWVANEDGTAEEKLGEPIFTVREIKGRFRAECTDGILGVRDTPLQAKRLCEEIASEEDSQNRVFLTAWHGTDTTSSAAHTDRVS